MEQRSLPAIEPGQECPICYDPLLSGPVLEQRRVLFLCSRCRRAWTHFSCARNAVKADRASSRLPLRCPCCRMRYEKEDLLALLPKRRDLQIKFCLQPIEETSSFEVNIVEIFDARIQPPSSSPSDSLQQRKVLSCRFFGSDLPPTDTLFRPAEVSQVFQEREENGRVYLPVPPPPPPTVRSEDDDEEEDISPLRLVIRKHLKTENSLRELNEAVRQLRLRPRIMTRNSRRSRETLNKLKARVSCMRRLYAGLNSELLEFCMANRNRRM